MSEKTVLQKARQSGSVTSTIEVFSECVDNRTGEKLSLEDAIAYLDIKTLEDVINKYT